MLFSINYILTRQILLSEADSRLTLEIKTRTATKLHRQYGRAGVNHSTPAPDFHLIKVP